MALSKGKQGVGLGAGPTTGMGLAYGQGYGQGKESALDEINKQAITTYMPMLLPV